MSETELESLLLEGGARLFEPPTDVDELIDLLDVSFVLDFWCLICSCDGVLGFMKFRFWLCVGVCGMCWYCRWEAVIEVQSVGINYASICSDMKFCANMCSLIRSM